MQILETDQKQLKNNQDTQNNGKNSARTNYLANVLDECLEGIDLCPDGIRGRFIEAYQSMKLTENDVLSDHLSIITNRLYRQFIYSFMIKVQNEIKNNAQRRMGIHDFNTYHNLYCLKLNIPKLEDGFAKDEDKVDKKIKDEFNTAVTILVNNCTKLREITEESSNRLKAIFTKYNISQIDSIPVEKIR